jgi:hypothetical protein
MLINKDKNSAIVVPVVGGVASRATEWRLLIALCMVAALLCGCALSRAPEHEEVVKQALPQGTSIPSTWSSAAVTSEVTNDWLRSFNDPRLDTLVAEAITHNLNLR